MNMNFAAVSARPAARYNTQQRNAMLALAALALMILVAGPAGAQGLEKANSAVESVVSTLQTISIGVVTIAIIFAGYKVAFMSARFMDVVPVLIGGFLVGGAAAIASFLLQ